MYELLKKMCGIYAPAGEEIQMTNFILDYVNEHKSSWKTQPIIHAGNGFQENIILVFGKPRTAVFAHIDSIGFTVRYNNELVKLGGPRLNQGIELYGYDSQNNLVEGTLQVQEAQNNEPAKITLKSKKNAEPGTNLVYKQQFIEDEKYIQSCYLDNRLGVLNALKLCETLENGIVVFSTLEEVSGASPRHLGRFIYQNYHVTQALISDITWVTQGVQHGKGVAISVRDSGIPRRIYVRKIVEIAQKHNIQYQIEVESSGGSDGNHIQKSGYPIDWCFVGAPEDFVHTPNEKVHKKDFEAMLKLYQLLMQEL